MISKIKPFSKNASTHITHLTCIRVLVWKSKNTMKCGEHFGTIEQKMDLNFQLMWKVLKWNLKSSTLVVSLSCKWIHFRINPFNNCLRRLESVNLSCYLKQSWDGNIGRETSGLYTANVWLILRTEVNKDIDIFDKNHYTLWDCQFCH